MTPSSIARDLSHTLAQDNSQQKECATADKTALRRHLIAVRRAIATAQRARHDSAIASHVTAWWRAHPVAVLGVYWPVRHEPDLQSAYAALVAAGVQLALPVVTAPDAPLQFAAWTPGMPLTKDAFGVSIPAAPLVALQPQAVDAGGIATDTAQAHPGQPQRIAHAIHAARLAAVKTLAVRNESSL